eukprot:scaffold6479_cov101-Isochrysis_galbana.AAC.4
MLHPVGTLALVTRLTQTPRGVQLLLLGQKRVQVRRGRGRGRGEGGGGMSVKSVDAVRVHFLDGTESVLARSRARPSSYLALGAVGTP